MVIVIQTPKKIFYWPDDEPSNFHKQVLKMTHLKCLLEKAGL